MAKQVIPTITTTSAPTINENVAAGYPIGQKWFNTVTGVEYTQLTSGVWLYDTMGPVSMTYTQLLALKTASGLIPEQQYLMTDYQSVYEIPNTTIFDQYGDTISEPSLGTGTTEPIILTAITSNAFEPIVKSTIFPQDDIYYEITSDVNKVPGCTKGYIYRRIDNINNNDICNDFRNVKYRRWQLNVTNQHATGNVYYSKYSVIKKTSTNEIYIKISNVTGAFTNTSLWKRFDYPNLSYTAYTSQCLPEYLDGYYTSGYIPLQIQEDYGLGLYTCDIIIPVSNLYMDYYMFTTANTTQGVQSSYSNNVYNNTFISNKTLSNSVFFGGYIYNNTINGYILNNTIDMGFISNSIKTTFNNNLIGSNFESNDIVSCSSNLFLSYVRFNTLYMFNSNFICANFDKNKCGFNTSYNILGDSFSGNIIGDSFLMNQIGNNCVYNKIGDYAMSNIIHNNFTNNTILNSMGYNIISTSFQQNDIGNNFQCNNIGIGFMKNKVTSYFNPGQDPSTIYYFSVATYVYQPFNKELYTTENGLQKLRYYDDSSTLIIVDANS